MDEWIAHKTCMERKVLLIPYIRGIGGCRTRFVVVQHAASSDWTFISGTCEPNERPIACALRELAEETLGWVQIGRMPKNTRHVRIVLGEERKRIDVYFIPVRRGGRMLSLFHRR